MDMARGFDDGRHDGEAVAVGGDERRMHVRAYNHWVSLLGARAYPSIASLDPGSIADFGANSVLIDFTRGLEDPVIRFLGSALRAECAIDASIERIADVPGRSLLSRLTDHYLQIIANRAPVGFEAEFVNTRGHNTMYRGILMPFSSDGDDIDFIYGVINWKEVVDTAAQAGLDAEVAAALRTAPAPAPTAAVWADGPSSGLAPAAMPADQVTLADRLAAARDSAVAAGAADTRSRAALYQALGRAHDFAIAAERDPGAYDGLLEAAGIAVRSGAPMTAVARLVFGTDTPKARLTEFAAVLANARRIGVPGEALAQYLAALDGGMKTMVAAERVARRGSGSAARDPAAALAALPTIATLGLDTGAGEGHVLLLGRIAGASVEVIATLAEPALVARAMRRAAA